LTAGAPSVYHGAMAERRRILLVRHGETPWAVAGKHTGRSDIALSPAGEQEARRLGDRLRGGAFAAVLSSPLKRAWRTAELAGFAAEAVPDLQEWHYGAYDGLTAAEIRARRPDWRLFRDGAPGGERLQDVVARVDRVVDRLRACVGDALVFSHGHLLRVLGPRLAGLPPETGERLMLSTAAVCVLNRDPGAEAAVIERWNDVSHLS
jgi:broad specificity phosphatase PhoE